jgi:hypothetical protein
MCPKRSIKLVILALALLATTSPWVRAQDQIVGIVGKWEVVGLKGSCPAREDPKFKLTNTLGFGQPICENTCVAGGSGTLTVEFPGKPSVLGVFACEDKPNPDCDRPIGKKCAFAVKPPVEKHWVVSLATEVMAMFSEPERYITPVSRGLEPHLVDSVIALEGNRADFGPAFADMDPGTYKIRLEPMAEKGSGSTVQVEWRGKGPVSAAVAGLKPGLYRLLRLTAESQPAEPRIRDAWVLVDGPDRFSEDSSGFHAAVEETKSWPEEVDPRVPRAVLRAYLDKLAKGSN